TNLFNQREARFDFRPGPVFANVVLVDEINRTSPKTQSGLLECMQERQVSIDKQVHELARPFMVIATQNPIEYEGTYPLPEAQLDRFMVQLVLGYPEPDAESDMLATHGDRDVVFDLDAVADVGTVLAAQAAAAGVHGSDALRRYVVALCGATREDFRVGLGAGPRPAPRRHRYPPARGRPHANRYLDGRARDRLAASRPAADRAAHARRHRSPRPGQQSCSRDLVGHGAGAAAGRGRRCARSRHERER